MTSEHPPTPGSSQVIIGTVPSQRGATVETVYAARKMRAWAIYESEVKMIAMFNTLAATLFGLSSSLTTGAIGIWSSAAFSEKLTPIGEALCYYFAPIMCGLAVVFGILGVIAYRYRGSTWDTICKDTIATYGSVTTELPPTQSTQITPDTLH